MSRCKYYKQIEQVSYDGGETWEYVDPAQYQKGELYQADSDDCLYGRWTLVPGGYICEDDNKYQKKVFEVSDDAINFRIKYPAEYTKGDLIEENSIECTFKWYGRYYYIPPSDPSPSPIPYDRRRIIDPIKTVLCYGNDDILTSGDTFYETTYKPYSGYIGTCVTTIADNALSGFTQLSSITISNSVITIGNDSFNSCISLTGVSIPNSVRTIGNYAFFNCSGMTSCSIGSGVANIGVAAFGGCNSLTGITIPNSVTTIGVAAFGGCSSLSSATLPNSIASINDNVFAGCSSLPSITIPNSVTSIGNNTFSNCSDLTNLTIPNSVTSIGSGMCSDCISLSSCTIGSGVTAISSSTFNNCSGLTNIVIPSSVTYVSHDAFSGCTSLPSEDDVLYADKWAVGVSDRKLWYYTLKSDTYGISGAFSDLSSIVTCTLPYGLKIIGERAFYESGIYLIDIPNSVTTIGDRAFAGCNSLGYNEGNRRVDIPNSVTTIGERAFSRCDNVYRVSIGSGVTYIGDSAFFYAGSHSRSTYIYATTPPTIGTNPFDETGFYPHNPIYVPSESVDAYKTAWPNLADRIFAMS